MLNLSITNKCFLIADKIRFFRVMVLLLATVLVTGCSYFQKEEDYSDADAQELYEKAQKAMSKKRYEAAVEILRTLEAKYPYGIYAEQAQLDTIYAYYLSEQTGLALAAADRFIKLNPTHDSVDYAYYLKGLVSFEEDGSLFGRMMGQDDLSDRDASSIKNAMTAFEELYTRFPDSQYAAEAKKRAKYLRNALAKNEIAVARYYYSRAAYVAVVNRSKGVVENYSATPAVEQALALMVFSYANMGFAELSEDSRRVLELNFPESKYLGMEADKVKFSNTGFSTSDTSSAKEDDGWFSSIKNAFTKDEPKPDDAG